jgi:uncharacterized protein (TIGR03086 family)
VSDVVSLFQRAVDEFDKRVQAVSEDQWDGDTPCTEWSVRDLVNHVVAEDRWVRPLIEGKTIAEVGGALDGDLLGDDPKRAWKEAAEESVSAASSDGALTATCHVSFGDIPGEEYLSQVLSDNVVHSWDLARGVGADERLDPELVDFTHSYLAPQIEAWRSAGAVGPALEVPDDADAQTKLLAMMGRKA